MTKAVVQGATLRCTCSETPSLLLVTSQDTVKIGHQPAATVLDMVPVQNIPLFGTCKALTAAASGTPTPCALAPGGSWEPGSTSRVSIGTLPALLLTDTLTCAAAPGVIAITDPGQGDTYDT